MFGLPRTFQVGTTHSDDWPSEVVDGVVWSPVQYLRGLLRTALDYEFRALAVLFVRTNEQIQVCYWQAQCPDVWEQLAPSPGSYGLAIIAEARRRFGRRQPFGARRGDFMIAAGRMRAACKFWSPHTHEFRMLIDGAQPPCEPYEVVFPYRATV